VIRAAGLIVAGLVVILIAALVWFGEGICDNCSGPSGAPYPIAGIGLLVMVSGVISGVRAWRRREGNGR
jgi:hypothetical protein